MVPSMTKPFMPPSRAALDADWHRSFVRTSTAAVLGQIQRTFAETILQTWPDDARAGLILRGAVEPTKLSALSGNAVTKILHLAPRSAAARLFESAVKIDLTGVSSFSFPLATSFTEATFVEEGYPIPLGQGDFAGMPLGPVRKVALIAALTNELERASADTAAIIISHVLEIAVGNGLDKVWFSADAASDIAPAGLLFGVTPVAGSADMAKDLSALVAAISDAGIDAESVAFVAAAPQAITIKLTARPHFNHRVISANITPGTVIAIATAGLAVAGSGLPVVDACKGGTLHLFDPASAISTPGAPATIAAPTRDLYQTDSFALRCIARITWAAAPGSIAALTGATW